MLLHPATSPSREHGCGAVPRRYGAVAVLDWRVGTEEGARLLVRRLAEEIAPRQLTVVGSSGPRWYHAMAVDPSLIWFDADLQACWPGIVSNAGAMGEATSRARETVSYLDDLGWPATASGSSRGWRATLRRVRHERAGELLLAVAASSRRLPPGDRQPPYELLISR